MECQKLMRTGTAEAGAVEGSELCFRWQAADRTSTKTITGTKKQFFIFSKGTSPGY
jgi:hypothetical protein